MTQLSVIGTPCGVWEHHTISPREEHGMADQIYPAVLLLGMPGSGKGTQGKLLGKIRGIFHLSTGDIFRSLDRNSDDGRLVAEYSSRGQLAPDDVTVRIWKKWLEEQKESQRLRPNEHLLLLDGIPRNVHQCELLEGQIRVHKVVHLNCHNEEPIVQRLRQRALVEGRSDDADESIIRRRFEVYRRETAPVLAYYDQSLIEDIDPMGTPAEVLKRILEVLIPVIVSLRGTPPSSLDGDEVTPDDAE